MLAEALEDPDFKLQAVKEADGVTTFYVNVTTCSDEVIVKTYTVEARASVLQVAQMKGKPIAQVNVDVFIGGVNATSGKYTFEFDANASFARGEASFFDFNLGLGLGIGFGIKDNFVSVKLAGCGFQVGRKVSVSVFGGSFGIDFGRLWDSL